jgi:hypothetical protein
LAKVEARDHFVRRAHDIRSMFGTIQCNPVRRKYALKGGQMLGVAID